jgi:superfamily II DNA or RNA helicase
MTVLMGDTSIHEFSESHNDSGVMPRMLRYYQSEARDAVLDAWARDVRRVGVVLPTGTGKSSVIGSVVAHAYDLELPVVLLAHRAELLDQMIRDTKVVAPHIPDEAFGIVRAEHDDHKAPIVAATFQTLANGSRRQALGERQVILIDETHHIVAEGYHNTFTALGGYDDAFVCGFTATMYRAEMTKGRGTSIGLGDVIQEVVYEKDLRWAIEEGFLVPPTGLTVRIEALNALNKIKNVGGDFNQGELAEIMEAAIDYTVDAVEMHARDRRSIIFGASVEACRMITEQLNARGVLRAATVVGTLGYEDRKPIYEAFRNGEVDCMVTVDVLSEGADFPMCDCIVMGRPTRSRIRYSQMVGRSLRTYTDPDTGVEKTDALVLDLSGSVRQMKLIHLSELVHGIGIETKEVDEDGEEIEIPACPITGEPVNTCMCDTCCA